MAEMVSPITRQVSKEKWEAGTTFFDINLQDVEDCLIYDRRGVSSPFKSLYQHSKTVIIFVRNFLCYSCKDYVDDLSKVPRGALEEAGIRLVVIGQSAPQHIEWEETDTAVKPPGHGHTPKTESNNHKTNQEAHSNIESALPSPHVKSGLFMGQIKSIWRAMTSPTFDFQGDLHQQGGAIIVGPGSQVHFCHFDINRLDHMPITWLLQLAGVQQTLDFSDKPKIIHV
ncbi:Peroxiredoxin-like 2C [Ilyodon furcidens]|uniref:Peroxiredoxin-like 2C n=1 Tax=Ilyodon furcidens TaxID=33524 RepID=A0ABV0V239_9TELE